MIVSEVLQKLNAVRRRPSRIADFLREPRDIVVGGRLANRLGLQPVRAAKDEIAWRLRRPHKHPTIAAIANEIDQKGYVVIPDFLPESEFGRVYAEYRRSRTEPYVRNYRRVQFGDNYFMDDLLVTDYPGDYPAMHRLVRDNETLALVASSVSRRQTTYRPHIHVQRIHKPNWSLPHTDLDYNQFPHADRHFRFVKCFFYLEDVTADNAPYSYAPGSHVINWERLRYEYMYSLRYVKVRQSAKYHRSMTQLESDKELCALAEALLARLGTEVRPLTGRANTMIISNNQGFHRRAEFRGRKPRVIAQLDFKFLESRAQWLFPLLGRLYD